MASAIKSTKKIEKVVEVEEEIIVLTLTKQEARFISDVFSKIGGHPVSSRRKYQDSISSALSSAGISYRDRPYDISGSLNCQ